MGRDRKGTQSHARLLCPFVKRVVVRLPWEPAGRRLGQQSAGSPGRRGPAERGRGQHLLSHPLHSSPRGQNARARGARGAEAPIRAVCCVFKFLFQSRVFRGL